MKNKELIIIRGGGDIATGIAYRLFKAHYKILMLEVEAPLAVRLTVSAAAAVFDGEIQIEDMHVKRIKCLEDIDIMSNDVNVFIDPSGTCIKALHPNILIDAIMAKRNTGTTSAMAPIVIGIGPGFRAPDDVNAVIETKRGHYLGRAIYNGEAIPNTGIPGIVNGYGVERVLRAPSNGFLEPLHRIGDHVVANEIIAFIDDNPVVAPFDGIIRGLIHHSVPVKKGLKIGDVDPRQEAAYCHTLSDKVLAVGGGVLEAVSWLQYN